MVMVTPSVACGNHSHDDWYKEAGVALSWMSTFGGKEWWNGIVEWTAGMVEWTAGMVECFIGHT